MHPTICMHLSSFIIYLYQSVVTLNKEAAGGSSLFQDLVGVYVCPLQQLASRTQTRRGKREPIGGLRVNMGELTHSHVEKLQNPSAVHMPHHLAHPLNKCRPVAKYPSSPPLSTCFLQGKLGLALCDLHGPGMCLQMYWIHLDTFKNLYPQRNWCSQKLCFSYQDQESSDKCMDPHVS